MNWNLRYASEKMDGEICGCGEPATDRDQHGSPVCNNHSGKRKIFDDGKCNASSQRTKERCTNDAAIRMIDDDGTGIPLCVNCAGGIAAQRIMDSERESENAEKNGNADYHAEQYLKQVSADMDRERRSKEQNLRSKMPAECYSCGEIVQPEEHGGEDLTEHTSCTALRKRIWSKENPAAMSMDMPETTKMGITQQNLMRTILGKQVNVPQHIHGILKAMARPFMNEA